MIVNETVKLFGKSRENLLPILQKLIEIKRFLDDETLQQVAKEMELSPADVYGTASFYSFLETSPRGKNVIRICRTISCDMKIEKEEIIEALEKKLNIKLGETTKNEEFSLLETNCLGHCHQGPAMLVNDEVFTNLSPERALKIIEEYSLKSKN